MAILQVICYYDAFNHPLTLDEIKKNSGVIICKAQNLVTDLNELLEKQLIKCADGHYFLLSKTKTVVEERLKKEALAKKTMNKAVADTIFFCGEALYNGDSPGTVEASIVNTKRMLKKMKKVL